VLEDDYGILCIRLIVVCVQADLLAKGGALQAFINSAATGHGPTFKLASIVPHILHEQLSLTKRSSNNLNMVPPPAYSTTGFNADHAGLLLDYLHRERDLFLRARISKPGHWAGWSALFYAMWEKLVAGSRTEYVTHPY
jgi:hypothetical protein